MKPITAPKLLSNGIVVYVPTPAPYIKTKLEIFYSKKNPLFSYSFCEESPQKIWEKTDVAFDKGSLFLYTTSNPLAKGFYRIMITQYDKYQTQSVQGSKVYGLLKEKPSLYIGLPYSSFDPILVS
jgi:hypothetical protein